MAPKTVKSVATIDVALVTVGVMEGSAGSETLVEYGIDTATKVGVEAQIETTSAVKLIVKGILRAQKPEVSTLTGVKITLTDNLFSPKLVQIFQGGTIVYDTEDPTKVKKYTPPISGSTDKGMVSTINTYSAIYDTAGLIVGYEKTTFPNCQGTPIALSSEDGVFRVSEYVINSAPSDAQAPYDVNYIEVADLPVVS